MARLIFLIIFTFILEANAKPIISDISQKVIRLDTRFDGENLFLFGVRNITGDIIVAVRGPKHDYKVRKKENVLGMWLNRKQMEFNDIYGYYAIYSTIPESEIKELNIFKSLDIGIDNLSLNYKGKAYIEDISDFKQAILDNKFKDRLYTETLNQIEFMGDSLFKTNVIFPKKIPKGIYNVEIYLIDDGELSGVQSIPLEVKKTGFESAVYNFAHTQKLFYGILCVLAAIVAGWCASIIFWKV